MYSSRVMVNYPWTFVQMNTTLLTVHLSYIIIFFFQY